MAGMMKMGAPKAAPGSVNGAQPIKQGMNGKHFSAKSKTKNSACSLAMSAWVLTRKSGTTPPAVFAQLAQCRAMARGGRQADLHQAAGNDLKAQRLRSQIAGNGPITKKDRMAKAKELVAARKGKVATVQAPAKLATQAIPKRAPHFGDKVVTADGTKGVKLAKARVAKTKAEAKSRDSAPVTMRTAGTAALPGEKIPARPTVRAQADAARAAKGNESFRARALLAKTSKGTKASITNAKRAQSKGDATRATKHTERATVLAGRSEKLAGIATGGKWTKPISVTTPKPAPSLRDQARSLEAGKVAPSFVVRDGTGPIPKSPTAREMIPARPAAPSLREQAATHRAGKGDMVDRAVRIQNRLASIRTKSAQAEFKARTDYHKEANKDEPVAAKIAKLKAKSEQLNTKKFAKIDFQSRTNQRVAKAWRNMKQRQSAT